jgi:hypothetical protein
LQRLNFIQLCLPFYYELIQASPFFPERFIDTIVNLMPSLEAVSCTFNVNQFHQELRWDFMGVADSLQEFAVVLRKGCVILDDPVEIMPEDLAYQRRDRITPIASFRPPDATDFMKLSIMN